MDPFKYKTTTLYMDQANNVSKNSYELTMKFSPYVSLNERTTMIGLKYLALPYAFYNISSALGNNSISYIWIDGITYNVTIPDGVYDLARFNQQLHLMMYNNTHYLNNGDVPEYYINFYESPVANKFSVVLSPLPATLPSGYTYPTTHAWTLSAGKTPQIVFLSNKLSTFTLGFNPQTFPLSPQATEQDKVSDTVPNITSYTTIYVRCSLAQNSIVQNDSLSQSIYSFSPGVSLNALIVEKPESVQYTEPVSGTHAQVTVQVYSKNLDGQIVPLPLVDTSSFQCQINLLSLK